MFLIHTTKAKVAAYANWGRWIVDCPTCSSALQMTPQNPFFQCWECGASAEVVWPPEEIRLSIERLLLMRPRVEWQSWNPGETLPDLMRENAELGVFDPLKTVDFDPGQSLLSVENDGIRADMLPVTRLREFQAIGQ